MSNFKSKNHSKFLIYYHIIFVCKYRQSLLTIYGDDIKQSMLDIANKYEFDILEIEVDKNHIHFMIGSVPKLSPLQIVRVLKQQSIIYIWQKYGNDLRKYFWHKTDRTFWTDGYIRNSSR